MNALEGNWDKRCRSCLSICEVHIMLTNKLSICDEEIMISDIIFSCTGVQISADDGWPQTLCSNCSNAAIISYRFRASCLMTVSVLQTERDQHNLKAGFIPEAIEESADIPSVIVKHESMGLPIEGFQTNCLEELTNNLVVLSATTLEELPANTLVMLPNNSLEELSNNTIQELATTTIQELATNTLQEFTNNTIQDFTTNTVQDFTTNTVQDFTTNTLQDFSTNTIQDFSTNTIQDFTTNTIQEHATDTIPDLSTNTIQDLSTNTIQELSTNAFEELVTKTLEELSATTLEELSTNTLEEPINTPPQQTQNSPTKPVSRDKVVPNKYPCDRCERFFNSRSTLRNHRKCVHMQIRRLSNDSKIICKMCPFESNTLLKFIDHLKKHQCGELAPNLKKAVSDALISQEVCSKLIQLLGEYTRDADVEMQLLYQIGDIAVCEIDIHGVPILASALPPEAEPELETVVINDIRLETVKEHVCEICDKVLKDETSLIDHRRKVHGVRIEKSCYNCPYCPVTSDLISVIAKHKEDMHAGLKKHACSTCGEKFFKRAHLKKHAAVHDKEAKQFMCDICGRRFSDKSNLQTHIRIHTGEKPYDCKVCGKKYAQWSSWKMHQDVHSEARRHVCTVCGFAMKSASSLRRHSNVHVENRKFKCPLCEQELKNKDQVKLHIRYHHKNERRFPCKTCGKAFQKMFTLKVHERVHTGERPYLCHECDKDFTQACVLRAHMKKFHPDCSLGD